MRAKNYIHIRTRDQTSYKQNRNQLLYLNCDWAFLLLLFYFASHAFFVWCAVREIPICVVNSQTNDRETNKTSPNEYGHS